MTRMIDADVLSEKLCKITTFIKDGEKFQRMINDAPTIESDGDLISRQDALAEFQDGRDVYDIMESIEELPPAEPKTGMVLCALADRACPFQGKEFVWCLTCPHISEEDRNLVKKAVSEPSRQRGEWLWDSGDGEYFCSECRTAQGNSTTEIISGEWKFCPNCGANMREGDNNGNGI